VSRIAIAANSLTAVGSTLVKASGESRCIAPTGRVMPHTRRASKVRGTIVVARLIGAIINFTPIDPIKALFWSAVINGNRCGPRHGDDDLGPKFPPVWRRVLGLMRRDRTLDRRRLEFSGLAHPGGLVAPGCLISEIGTLWPIAPCGRSSL
jgi:hypothetical protein